MKIECFLSMLRPMKRGLEVHIKANAYKKEQVREIVKLASEIQKEYSCYCTLNVNLPNKVPGIKLTHASKG